MVPSPYSVRWTSKLIYRDFKGLAANCTSKLKSLFSTYTNAPAPGSHTHIEIEPPIESEALHDISWPSSVHSFDSSADDDSSLIVPADGTQRSADNLDTVDTLYGLLTTKLKMLYASRERYAPLEERWKFRGAWLLLDMATQCCASNPSFSISRGEHSAADEASLLLQVLQHSVSTPLEAPTTKSSKVATVPCTYHHDGATRPDSGYASLSSPPSLALLWYTVFAGATEPANTIHAAECLLGHMWPEKDAAMVLEAVGNPTKRLSEDESMDLRNKLGYLLYPGYYAPLLTNVGIVHADFDSVFHLRHQEGTN